MDFKPPQKELEEIKDRLMLSFGWKIEQIREYWVQPNPLFGGKSCLEMCKDPKSYRQMKTLFRFSTIPAKLRDLSNTQMNLSNTK